jgi:WD40 repeat protein
LPTKESIIYVDKSGVAQIWNVRTNRSEGTFGNPGTFNAPQFALSPDGKWFAGLTRSDTVSIWNVERGQHAFSLRPEAATVWSLAWNASSTQLAVGQSDGGLAVWHLPHIQKKLAAMGLPWKQPE